MFYRKTLATIVASLRRVHITGDMIMSAVDDLTKIASDIQASQAAQAAATVSAVTDIQVETQKIADLTAQLANSNDPAIVAAVAKLNDVKAAIDSSTAALQAAVTPAPVPAASP